MLKYQRLPKIDKSEFIEKLKEIKVISRVCKHFNINTRQYHLFIEMYQINTSDYFSEDEVRAATKRYKIEAVVIKLGITKESLLKTVSEYKLINDIMKYYGLVSKTQLNNIFEYFELDYDKLVPLELRKKLVAEKIKKTNLEKYGVENVMQNLEVVDRLKDTLNRRTELEIKKSNKKREETNLEKYGVKSNLLRDDVQKTILEKFGTDNVMKNEEVAKEFGEKRREKFEELISKDELTTCILELKTKRQIRERFSLLDYQLEKLLEIYEINFDELVSTEEQVAASQKRRLKTNLKRYGAEHNWSKFSTTRNNVKQTWLDKYGYDNPFGVPEIREQIIQTKLRNGSFVRSRGEQEIVDFIKTIYQGEIITNTRSVISDELDIYIPEFKLAIEYNGAYWHSMQARMKRSSLDFEKAKNYHYNKSRKCEEVNIRLIHVFEPYWEDEKKQNIYKQIISNAMGVSLNKISAKKCELKVIDYKIAKEFLEINHLGGVTASSINYGLYYKDELIQVEQFSKPRFNKNIEWESTRGSSKLGWMIYGGYEKVLKTFKEEYNAQSIVSYVDYNIFSGKLHEHAGFVFNKYTGPDHWYLDLEGNFKRYWIVRGNKPEDLVWEQKRKENTLFEYYFAGSKTYIWKKNS